MKHNNFVNTLWAKAGSEEAKKEIICALGRMNYPKPSWFKYYRISYAKRKLEKFKETYERVFQKLLDNLHNDFIKRVCNKALEKLDSYEVLAYRDAKGYFDDVSTKSIVHLCSCGRRIKKTKGNLYNKCYTCRKTMVSYTQYSEVA